MLAPSQREHIDNVLAVSQTGAAASDPIHSSWVRCVRDYGLDPCRPTRAHIVEHAQLREHKDQIEEFLGVARTGMEQLYKRMAGIGYVLLLTDAHGIAVDFIGNDAWARELKQSGLYLGADWSEVRAGTCAVGTCIVEKAPITVHHTDHFDATHISLTCNAAPLFDPTGGFLGVLDVSALTSPSPRESQHLALQMVTMYAQMVEDANFLRYFRDRWVLRLGSAWSMVDVAGEIMLAFDGDGVIVGTNSGARRALRPLRNGPGADTLIGRPLSDVFREGMDAIWRIARAGASADRSALSTGSGEVYFGTVQAPRVTPQRIMPSTADTPCAPALERLAGDDPQMQRLISQASRLVNRPVNILVHGETGTGKEVLAKALHESSSRSSKPFVAVNCAAIPESLIESELFGYTAGTFTGGRSKGMRGLIQQSDGGTLFLDEIGDMPLHLQTRLLRVLAEREVLPLGAEKPVPVRLTVVAASHRDLRKLIAEGRFREDLYYRLCGAILYLPPLRERLDRDYLIERLLAAESAELDSRARLDQAAHAALLSYDWPGNVRQLRNVLRFALAVCDGTTINIEDLPAELMTRIEPSPVPDASAPIARTHDEASVLQAALRRQRWNVTAVAAELGICRATVYRQMKRYGIVPPNQA
ncbi:GAF domain-containing protein [Azoarcus communis]|uniref:Sigma-54-dependent Fis family transcriptional regulator n=1 Tax=Parazoarcus communis SWub3 = DSM 12120 TaxID=1121029 RepID=A0A323V1E4_9RHOO|nr:sigma-54-dependent Fis family transcriptional regulator [Parazoarcus communis]NMG47638.1 GAF domain-containing protein [Parazoarcus communis]NMG68668.1 GAF domain-containing protein [Parazoarcus communis SWub3 = DSM 12120]PZA17800.1 sigma-54-dependent Fis family transcriptional regulator [Azoarcus communis] [Parazoarcus communis SWub3 = DSM 12120]